MKIFKKINKLDLIIQSIQDEQKKKERLYQSSHQDTDDTTSDSEKDTKDFKISSSLKKLWILCNRERKRLSLMIFAMLLNSILGLFSIGLVIPLVIFLQNTTYLTNTIDFSDQAMFKQIIIRYSIRLYELLDLSNPNTLVLLYGIAFVIMFSLKSIVGVFLQCKIKAYSLRLEKHISSKMYTKLLYISFPYYLGRSTTRTINTLTTLSTHVQGAILALLNTANDLSFILIIGVGILLFSPAVLLGSVFLIMISYFIYRYTKLELINLGHIELELYRKKTEHIYMNIHNLPFSRLLHTEPTLIKKFANILENMIPTQTYKTVLISLPRIFLEILLVVLFSAYAIYTTVYSDSESIENLITTAAFIATAILKLMPAILRFIAAMNHTASNYKFIDEFYTEYTAAKKHSVLQSTSSAVAPLPFTQQITIDKISYAYPDFSLSETTLQYHNATPVLENLSLTIQKGQHIGIIGGSGGGKTTLMHLMMAFLEPSAGEIRVDNVNIHQEMRRWHKNIGYVPQDIILTNGTIKENIGFGVDPSMIDETKIEETLKLALLWEFVQQQPHGTHTQIGDAGKRLSGGQRQRLGIARALYTDPTIMFFDEATSNLDQKTEKEIQAVINNLDKNITTVMIAHRLVALKNCDRIYCIENKTIVFEGTYEQMIKKYGTHHG